MALKKEMVRQGNFLFRWRSYFPLILVPVLFGAYIPHELAGENEILEISGLVVTFGGLILRAFITGHTPKDTSGRNTRKQIAEKLNTTGMYSIVRHPLYFANFLIFMGIVIYISVWWFMLIALLGYFIYYERIMSVEEDFLIGKFGDEYYKWSEVTPAFIPKLKGYIKPSEKFSLKTVLKREYTTFFVAVFSFFVLEILGKFVTEGKLDVEPLWGWLLIVAVVQYLVFLTLKLKTKILNVDGR